MDTFDGERVIYACLKNKNTRDDETKFNNLSGFVRGLHQKFSTTEDFQVEKFKFTPHITLLKFRQGKGGYKQIKQIQAKLKGVMKEVCVQKCTYIYPIYNGNKYNNNI